MAWNTSVRVRSSQCAVVAFCLVVCHLRDGPAEIAERLRPALLPLSGEAELIQDQFSMKILVKERNRHRTKLLKDETGRSFLGVGLAFVTLEPGERFVVRLTNGSEHDSAVALSIDGLNVFEFSESPRCEYLLIPRHGSILVKGWRRTASRTDPFVTHRYPKHARARALSNPDEVGTITALFYAAWASPDGKPIDERGRLLSESRRDRLVHAEPGERARAPVKRYIGRLRAVINVRYLKIPASTNDPPCDRHKRGQCREEGSTG